MKKKNKNINKLWGNFKKTFWYIILFVLILKFIAYTYEPEFSIWLVLAALDISAKIFMAFHVGKYAYLITGKKIDVLFGLLGLFWLGFIGIALAYFAIKSLKNKELEKTKTKN